MIVIPGLVNAHHHVGLTPFQLGALDAPLETWVIARMANRDVDPYLDTLYCAMQMIESGITTVMHNHGLARLPVDASPYDSPGLPGVRHEGRLLPLLQGPEPTFVRRR